MWYLDYFPNYFWPSKDHRINLYEIMDFDNLRSIFWFYPVFRILLNCLHFEKRKHCSYPTSDQCFHLLSSNCTCDRKSKDFKMISVGSWEENWSQKIRKSISSSFWTVWSVKGIYVMNKGRFEARISADHSSRSFCTALIKLYTYQYCLWLNIAYGGAPSYPVRTISTLQRLWRCHTSPP